MPTRTFVDGRGVEWTVWQTVPLPGSVVDRSFAQGWLAFECAGGIRRRLAPVPTGWELVDVPTLCRLLEQSIVATRARRTSGQIDAVAPDTDPPQSTA